MRLRLQLRLQHTSWIQGTRIAEKKMACGPRISWGDQLVPVAAKPADRLGGAKFIGCSSKICFLIQGCSNSLYRQILAARGVNWSFDLCIYPLYSLVLSCLEQPCDNIFAETTPSSDVESLLNVEAESDHFTPGDMHLGINLSSPKLTQTPLNQQFQRKAVFQPPSHDRVYVSCGIRADH